MQSCGTKHGQQPPETKRVLGRACSCAVPALLTNLLACLPRFDYRAPMSNFLSRTTPTVPERVRLVVVEPTTSRTTIIAILRSTTIFYVDQERPTTTSQISEAHIAQADKEYYYRYALLRQQQVACLRGSTSYKSAAAATSRHRQQHGTFGRGSRLLSGRVQRRARDPARQGHDLWPYRQAGGHPSATSPSRRLSEAPLAGPGLAAQPQQCAVAKSYQLQGPHLP